MNNQQAIDRLVKHLEWGWTEETVEAIEMGIHALKETQWIPCSEKMPEDNTDVIVCFYSGTVTEMRYWGNGIFQGIYEHTAKTIVAWMPLPEPYKENDMSELKPCPRCGTKAYLSRDVVDGFYFGWSAGCPRYCHYDGIHGTTIDTSEEDCYAVHGANSKEEAIEIWNNRVEHLKELDQQKGCKKIFEEMQKNQLR